MAKFDDIMIGGRYNAESVITHMRPIQDQYNVTRTKMAKWIRKSFETVNALAKKAVAGQGLLIMIQVRLLSTSLVPNTGPPQPMQIPQMPSYGFTRMFETQDAWLITFAVSMRFLEVYYHQLYASSRYGVLQEQDQTRIGVQTSKMSADLQELVNLLRNTLANTMKCQECFKIAGDGLGYTVKEFVGKDFK